MSEPVKPSLDVDALARRLPRRAPNPERSSVLRRALLDAAQPQRGWWLRPPVRGWVLGVAGCAVAACVLIALRAPRHEVVDAERPSTATAAAVTASSGRPGIAQPLPEAGKPLPEAGVQIPEGVSSFDTTHPEQLAHGGATITAPPGARFDVEVRDDEIRRVTVKAGWVVIASSREAATTVFERQTWTSPVTPAPPVALSPALPGPAAPPGSAAAPGSAAPPGSSDRAPAVRRHPAPGQAVDVPTRTQAPHVAQPAAPPRRASSEPRTSTSPAAPDVIAPSVGATVPAPTPTGEQDFRDGLQALLAGDPRAAVAPLGRACGISSNTQDDVCYWAAVASLRAGDRVRARESLANVLTRWPQSTHAGEASVALGWLLLDHGDPAAARARFAAAADDRMPSVRAEALRGLAATR